MGKNKVDSFVLPNNQTSSGQAGGLPITKEGKPA
jgi:hypothetical protein